MAAERTPEEHQAYAAAERRIRAVLSQAFHDTTSWHMAELLDEPPQVCEQWIERMWAGLRGNLDDEDRLHAILILLNEHARAAAQSLVSVVDLDPRR